MSHIENITIDLHENGKLFPAITAIEHNGGKLIKMEPVKDRHAERWLLVARFADDSVVSTAITALRAVSTLTVVSHEDQIFYCHAGGKIRTVATTPITSKAILRQVYTPGVAKVCKAIEANPHLARKYTNLKNSVAIVTNGTAILGLGDIGAVAGMPVMEGKAAILSEFSDISGVPILIQSHDKQLIIDTVTAIAPSFGAILLEDIAAPDCFAIETSLMDNLPIPVFHDDQHGTAVVVLAVLLSAAKKLQLDLRSLSFGQVGLGAAGIGICTLLKSFGLTRIYGSDINPAAVARLEALGGTGATLDQVMQQADIVVATTGVKGLIKPQQIRKGQLILSLTNPEPEIEPEVALQHGAVFALDGKTVNNMLAFPGLFRGALDAGVADISHAMKIAAAEELAAITPDGELVPDGLNKEVHTAVANAVYTAALTEQ